MNDNTKDMKEVLDRIKPYMFIKGFAIGKGLEQTALALSVADRLHEGQCRKDGAAYITHPLRVCSTLISCGIDDDTTLAAALLHDVLEDYFQCDLGGAEILQSEYHIDREVVGIVCLLTKPSGLNDEELGRYFERIQGDHRAALVKLADRLHNSSTLYTFTLAKMRKYIRETDLFILPMASYCKKYYPKYSNAFNSLKHNIESMNHAMAVMMEKIEGIS